MLTTLPDSPPAMPIDSGANWDAGTYLKIAPHKLLPHPDNPRKRFDADALRAMANSMLAAGVAQPLVVRPLPSELLPDTLTDRATGQLLAPSDRPAYQIVAGERRWRAATLAQLADVPVLVRRLTDQQVLVIMTVENLQREDLSALEEARGLRRLMDETGASAEDVGRTIGQSKAYVYQALKLLDLCPEGCEALEKGLVHKAVASYLARLTDHQLQLRALEEVAGDEHHGPLPYRTAVQRIQTNFLLRLDRAPFDTSVADGWESGVGACTTCPHRTGHTADLFAEKEGADMCLQPACYRNKEEAAQNQRLSRAKAEGLHVITGREAKALMPAAWTGRVEGHLRLDDAQDSPSKRPLRALLEEEMSASGVKETLVENPGKAGELIAVLPVSTAQELLDRVAAKAKAKKDRDAASAMADRARDEAERAQERAREAEERKEREAYESSWRRSALRQVWTYAQMAADPQLKAPALRVVCHVLLAGLNSAQREQVAKLLELGKVATAQAARERIDSMPGEQLVAMVLVLLAARGVVWESWHQDGTHIDPALVVALAECDLDVASVQRDTRSALKAESAHAGKSAKSATDDCADPALTASHKGGRGKPGKHRKTEQAAPQRALLSQTEASQGIAAAMQSLESQSALPTGGAPLATPSASQPEHTNTTATDNATACDDADLLATSDDSTPGDDVLLHEGAHVVVRETAKGAKQAAMVGKQGVVEKWVDGNRVEVRFKGRNVPTWVKFEANELKVVA